MKLPHFVESLDDIPEAAHEFYEEVDGGHRLPVSGVQSDEDVGKLRSAFEKLKRELAGLKESTPSVSAEDLEELERLRTEAAEREQKKAEEEGNFAKLKEAMEQKHTKKLEQLQAEIDRRDSYIQRITVDNQLNQAIEDVGVLDRYRPAVRALLKTNKPKVALDGDDYRGVFETDMGEVEIAEFVRTWSESEAAEPYMPAVDRGGSGGTGSGGPRPGNGRMSRSESGVFAKNAEKIASGEVTLSG